MFVVGSFSTSLRGVVLLPILAGQPSSEFLELRNNKYLTYRIPHQVRVSARLLDFKGKIKMLLIDETMEAGSHLLLLPDNHASPLILDFQAGNLRKLTPL